jgi:BTB/POZ domain
VYSLHRDLLCKRCPYFKRCFDGRFKEAKDKKTALKDESPDAFDEVLRWIYSGMVPKPKDDKDFMPLINAYILADRLCIEELKNSIVTELCHFSSKNFATPSGIMTLAEKGLAGCKLRSFLLWKLSQDVVQLGYRHMLKRFPELKEYIAAGGDEVAHLFEITVGCKKGDLEVLQMDGKNKCRWHEHLATPFCDKQG